MVALGILGFVRLSVPNRRSWRIALADQGLVSGPTRDRCQTSSPVAQVARIFLKLPLQSAKRVLLS